MKTMKIDFPKLLSFSFFFLLAVLFVSCKKKEFCEEFNTGKITFVNNRIDTYECYVDSVYVGNVAPQSSTTFEVSVGAGQINAYQQSNLQNIITGSKTIELCKTVTFTF
jgi:hypothetical protein